jgi:hypothetical protein
MYDILQAYTGCQLRLSAAERVRKESRRIEEKRNFWRRKERQFSAEKRRIILSECSEVLSARHCDGLQMTDQSTDQPKIKRRNLAQNSA